MKIGMLWFDNDPKAGLNTKIERAASYYRSKYGREPNLCFVHPSMVAGPSQPEPEAELKSGGVEVRTTRTVLPNHFWIGIHATNAGD